VPGDSVSGAQFESSSGKSHFFQVLITSLFSLKFKIQHFQTLIPHIFVDVTKEFILLLKDTEFLCVYAKREA